MSFTFVPTNISIQRFDNNEVVNVPDITLFAWKQALEFETTNKYGMQMSRISASAVAKRTLGLPKGWSKVRVLEVVKDLLHQLEVARG